MKKKKISQSNLITFGIILVITILVVIAFNKPTSTITKENTKCIGENTILYTQTGCHACETQKDFFGKNYQYLTIIDCSYEKEKCMNIQATPTWIINNEEHIGVQSINKLNELTKC
ncbi:MAG: hypothetical protein U9Q99_03045 [Nanoarchaeota archaeon]|nr:hypothetical protein [Nanoarchaeota archaeon]